MNTNKSFSFSGILSAIIIVAVLYFGIGYLLDLPGRKASEVRDKVSTKVAPIVEKALSREGKTFKILEIGKNYIRIKGYVFEKNISPDDLTEPIPKGSTELMKVGDKYTPLIK